MNPKGVAGAFLAMMAGMGMFDNPPQGTEPISDEVLEAEYKLVKAKRSMRTANERAWIVSEYEYRQRKKTSA